MEQFIQKNIKKSWQEIADGIYEHFSVRYSANAVRNFANRRGIYKGGRMTPKRSISEDVELHRSKEDRLQMEKKAKQYIKRIAELEREVRSFEKIRPATKFVIKKKGNTSTSEATVVVLASDWHIEERVEPETVNGKNEHNLSIAKTRGVEFFQAVVRLTEILGRDVNISTMVLALLGDFITGDIHDEMLETAEIEPARAIIEAQKLIASGIQYILDNTQLNLVIPCHSGNHARTTKETRFATEAGHSLEYIMYHMLADHFRNNKRVKFIIPRSYHSYVEVYGTVVRFHHGHNLKYGGGVGGLTIPVNKAIAQWNKTEWADIDCFGHWHTRFDGGNFIANGSSIGFNAFAVGIKASFEKPSQTLFLIDKKRGKTCVWPILFSV